MESPTFTNIDISKFLPISKPFAVGRSTLERNCSDPLLLRMLEDGFYVDVTLKAKGGIVKAHRSVLASASTKFQEMFPHDTKASTLDLHDISIDCVQLFLLLLYTSNERTKEMPELNDAMDKHFDELFDVVQKFQVVRRLKVVLITALGRNLTPENCWHYLHKTNSHPLISIHEVCRAYIMRNFKEVMKAKSTISEMERNPKQVQKCIDYALTRGYCCGNP